MPSQSEPPSGQNSETLSHSRQNMRNLDSMARSSGIPPKMRNDESWVEIASQPSSSSLSSIGDEIVTTGLRVQHDLNSRRKRRTQQSVPTHLNLEARQTSNSSQEEYEESESEEDHVMTSSNENVLPATHLPNISRLEYDGGSSEEDDDDGNSTALGRRNDEPVFIPQPNAFSHPPSSHGRPATIGSYFPSQRTSNDRNPYSPRRHSSYNNHQADHDAALRASLTTLLSIGAAAARGLPKRNQPNATITSNEPMGLRLVPESELLGPVIPANTSRPLSPSTRARSSPSISSQEAIEKGKRKAAAPTATKAGEKVRAEKKRKKGVQVVSEGEVALISPTLLTWVMSAGVLVLVSVVGFGAGYVIGREVGRQEVLGGIQGASFTDGSSCGREMVRSSGTGSLRRFKWGIGGGGKSIVA